jgi:hypothetical protein
VATVGGRFEIETIPRTGYRLTLLRGDGRDDDAGATAQPAFGLSRRQLAAGATAAAVAGSAGLWWQLRPAADPHFDALMRQGERVRRDDGNFDPVKTRRALEEAIRIRPRSARAWGLLALLQGVQAPGAPPGALEQAENSARQALGYDPREPNALLALFELEGSTLDWTTRDRRLRTIIGIDPTNLLAISELVLMLQAAGLNRESWNWNERAIAIEPLSVALLGRRALKLWIAGRLSAADKVIDQARDLWPANVQIAFFRFVILALSGRAKAARAMVDGDPGMLDPTEGTLWSKSLPALDSRGASDIASARLACLAAAATGAWLAGQSMIILSALGHVNDAFEVADGALLDRGAVVRRAQPGAKAAPSNAVFKVNTQWLFTPPAAVMRADARFLPLCDGVGLTDYWRSRGVTPDYLRARA